VVGDAAGLADEFTEEGIYYAVKSGLIAADVIGQALERGFAWLGAYEHQVDRHIMPELRAARIIAYMFYAMMRLSPAAMMGISRNVSYFWNAFFRVQQGVTGYDDELARAWWLRPMLPLVNRASLRS
jgi:flavin-dependent dehydrogenase